jgi:biopolymer transport protein ExbD
MIDITPLIDLSFNLILFFMVSYSMGTISAITVHLPRAVQAGEIKSGDLIITVNEKNAVYVNDQPVDADRLPGVLKEKKARLGNGMVIIRGDKQTNYDTIIRVMDMLNQAGMPRFTLATTRSQK